MLQTLKVPTRPELAPREAALHRLRAIEAIRVNSKIKPPEGGSSRYVIDLYLHVDADRPHALSPTANARAASTPFDINNPGAALARHDVSGRDPTKSVGKRYLEVHEFKDQLIMTALSCRCVKRCRLCQNVFEYIAGLDKTPPVITRALSTTEMKKHAIEELITAFVSIAIRAQVLTTTPGASQCDSDEMIPILIKEFLTL